MFRLWGESGYAGADMTGKTVGELFGGVLNPPSQSANLPFFDGG
jgi:hypothetical protein